MNRCFYKVSILFLFLFLIPISQANDIIPVELKWQGVQRWHADSIYKDVIVFENASYPFENDLPYFHHGITIESGYSYKPELRNPVYVQLAKEENDFLRASSFPDDPEISTLVSRSRGNETLNIYISPFIRKEDEILKLKSFDLCLEKLPQARKSKQSAIHSFTDESVLSKGRFVKVRITESGIYKLTYNELKNKGIDPSNVRMFGYGGAVLEEDFRKAKYDDLPEIAIHDTGNEILFYAQGINSWTYDTSAGIFTHKINSYSNYGYYFVTSDNVGEKKRIGQKAELNTGTATVYDITEFTDYKVHEIESVNLVKGGKEFYGEKFSSGSGLNISFDFPNLIQDAEMKVRIEVLATAASGFTLGLNDARRKSIIISEKSRNEVAKTQIQRLTYIPNTANTVFNLTYGQTNASGYLNYIEVNALRKLEMNGSAMIFHNENNIGIDSYNRYLLTTSNPNVQVWDINDIVNVERFALKTVDGKAAFVDSASEARSYIAIDPANITGIPSAVLLNEIPPQNIHAMESVDMLIITHPSFVSAAERLKQAHYERGLKVGVVTTEEVYNEFSSGTPDATAYRWALKMFYDKPQKEQDKIKYLLLFGKGSFDNRRLSDSNGDNLVLTYQADNSLNTANASYVTDDYFGFLDDDEGKSISASSGLDIGIGRFPVKTETEAAIVVDKTIEYMQNRNKGGWKNQLCFIGDDDAEGDISNVHIDGADLIAKSIAKSQPAYHINKIYLDAFQQERNASGDSYPGTITRFHNLIRTGVFYINYMGHANANGWSNEGILTLNDIKKLKNNNLPLFTTGSCEFSRFDKEIVSGGEELLLNSIGGGIGVLAATRSVYPRENTTLQNNFANILLSFNKEDNMTIGDALMQAKNKNNTGVNGLCYVYFGDPAVKLNYPTQYNVLANEINGNPIAGNDTLRALSETTVKGIVADASGNKVTAFNGTLQVIVLDKEQTITTLANDAWAVAYEYKDRPNMIFKGKTEVKNGEFEFTFMLPKDIRYNYGTGKLNFCAWDDENDWEAQGCCENFIVGGSGNEAFDVKNGPDVEMYLNHKSFVSGGKVNETPVFMAELYDDYGINITNSTPGHAIMLSIDDKRWYELNDYYESEQGSYKKGSVSFRIPEMEEGMHTLTLRTWNLFNVSTIKSLECEVIKALSPEIFSVTCYPNPATTETSIQVKHDRENEIINMTVDIFDLSGRKVWSRMQDYPETINWNLTTSNGERLRSGMYIYRVSVQTNDKITSARSNKIIIKSL